MATILLVASLPIMPGCGGGSNESNGRQAQSPGAEDQNVGVSSGEAVVPVNREVPPAPKPTEPLPADASCVTEACHSVFQTMPYVHGAIRTGNCFVCHEADQGGHTYPLKREGVETCTFCHEVGDRRAHRHAVLDDPGCLVCHDPHVSEQRFLLIAASTEAVCLQCHVEDRNPLPHGPYANGECTACHDPHESDYDHLLRGGDGPAHCALCHAETSLALKNAAYIHPPAADDCTTCHAAHAAPYEHALKQPIEETCLSCHVAVREKIYEASVPHGAVLIDNGCANCHDSHAAGRPALLRDREDVLCMNCHDRDVLAVDGSTIKNMEPVFARRYLHGPVRTGDCSPCHDAHGATQSRLLTAEFTEAFYAPFDLDNFDLCFRCHLASIVLDDRTTTVTDFRDGNLNLHYVHVNRDRKGRTCRTCHVIHGSDLPRHIAESVPFEGSDWVMPINFEQTATGGACTPGCHERLAYDNSPPAVPPTGAPEGGAP